MARWIPRARGCSLYIRPTLIGTRPSLGVSASARGILRRLLPDGTPTTPTSRPLLACHERPDTHVARLNGQIQALAGLLRGIPRTAHHSGALLPVDSLSARREVAEAGTTNVFTMFEHQDGGMSLSSLLPGVPFICGLWSSVLFIHPRCAHTTRPPLGGITLPGVTRALVLALLSYCPPLLLPSHGRAPADAHAHPHPHRRARAPTLSELFAALATGAFREMFYVGTAAVVIPIAPIG